MTTLPPIESFCCAYWDYLRKLRKTEPNGADYGLCECAAAALALKCHQEFEKIIIQKAVEAAQAA